MSFFQSLQKPGTAVSFKAKPLQIRREAAAKPPSRKQPADPNTLSSFQKSTTSASSERKRKRHEPVPNGTYRVESHVVRRRARAIQASVLSSDESDSEIEKTKSIPGGRIGSEEQSSYDPLRDLTAPRKLSLGGDDTFPMVHAADITLLEKTKKFMPAFLEVRNNAELLLQYPSSWQQERYPLLKPQVANDDFDPLEDIVQVMHTVIENFLPNKLRLDFDDESTGYPQRLCRALKRKSEPEVRAVINEWNQALLDIRDEGIIVQHLNESRGLSPRLVERILIQTYTRTVSPKVQSLRDYENGTDNVYGELLPKFISQILREDTKIKSNHVFVDLGSGVGNVVLQAALEVGCESWGCEMMKNACDLADLQAREFQARCRLWGLSIGKIRLEKGDFLQHSAISTVLKRADVILVNNQAFTPALNEGLRGLFLDLKEGAQIVSLKSFVPAGHKITLRNIDSMCNVLDVKEKTYFSGCVSWTNAPGSYYLTTKDSRRLKAFLNQEQFQKNRPFSMRG
ncbi:Nucleosomal histone H3-Lys79 methylase [Agyrium rufum]|nr:Nucleosomal histone H3-Lys79 methylase [Agyrium rufum]